MHSGYGCAGVDGVEGGGGHVGEGTGRGEEEEGLESLEEGTTKEHSELVVAENGGGLSVTVRRAAHSSVASDRQASE